MRGIFIFTKDRPHTFQATLSSIDKTDYDIFIIDDSTFERNRAENKLFINRANHFYFGNKEYLDFVAAHDIEQNEYSFLLRQPGDSNWNLGYMRNFALLIAGSKGLDEVLFMDDDINVPSLNIFNDLFDATNKYLFTGAHILGLVDDSILGHVASGIGVNNERMISGGFMVFKPSTINHFFLNNYNEDWIWLFLHLRENSYIQEGEVYQAPSDPFYDFEKKVIFQEFGEIALDGIINLHPNYSYKELQSMTYWQKITRERKEYLTDLYKLSIDKNEHQYSKIIDYVISNSKALKAKKFRDLFEKYFNDRDTFQLLYNSLL